MFNFDWIMAQNLSDISLKKSSLGQVSNSGLIVAQNYTSLYLRIHSKKFFQTLQHDRVQ